MFVSLRPELCREDRMFNIAIAVLTHAELYNPETQTVSKGTLPKDSVQKFVSTLRLRNDIRKGLGLPVLEGESNFGDLRAHGDALGGHGLKLETMKKDGKKYVVVSDKVVKTCQDFLFAERSKFYRFID